MAPRVSVVLAVYNGERHIERSLRSVLGQSFTDFELIVIDDGSTDATPEIASSLLAVDARVRIARQEHRGLTASLNVGIALSRGAYLARQDADDISLPDRFARQVAYLDAHPTVAALGTSADVIDTAGAVTGALTARRGPSAVARGLLTLRNTPVHGSMMLRASAVAAAGGYRDAFRAAQDYDLWLRIASLGEIDNLPDVLYQWRLDRESVYLTRRARQLMYAGVALAFAHERAIDGRDSYTLLERTGGDLDRFAEAYRFGARVYAAWGELLLRGLGNTARVREYLRRALRRGDLRPFTLGLLAWTHLGLPWPGSRPLVPSSAGGGPAATP